jgi:hypothetical protein
LFTTSAEKRLGGKESMAQPSKVQPERRRTDRSALRLNATMRDGRNSRVRARVIDMSTNGCRIECTAPVEDDSWVWLAIAGLETQYCRVVWSCHEFAGVEFANPLSEAVLDRLLQDHGQLSETAIGELRAIATRTQRLSAQEEGERRTLTDLSRKCAVDAVVEGLKLGESKQAKR